MQTIGVYWSFFIIINSMACSYNNYHGEIRPKKIYNFGGNSYLNKRFEQLFGIHSVRADASNYIVFLNEDHYLEFLNLDDTILERFTLNFKDRISKLQYYTIKFLGKKMFLLDIEKNTLEQYGYSRDTILIEETYDLAHFINKDSLYIKFQLYNSFEIIYPILFLSYGTYESENGYLENTSYLKINLNELQFNSNSIDRILYYPSVFRKGFYRNSNTVLVKASDTSMLYGFENLDSIYLYHTYSNQILEKKKFSKKSFYRKFDRKKVTDLAYIRWFDQTGETNIKILSDQRGHYFIIKRKKKKSLKDRDVYEYYLLDKDLNITAHSLVPFEINPYYCFSYSNGFLIFNADRSQAYYYEF